MEKEREVRGGLWGVDYASAKCTLHIGTFEPSRDYNISFELLSNPTHSGRYCQNGQVKTQEDLSRAMCLLINLQLICKPKTKTKTTKPKKSKKQKTEKTKQKTSHKGSRILLFRGVVD